LRVGILNICMDGIGNSSIQRDLTTKLIENGIEVAWATFATKSSFDYIYNLCSSTPDGVILTGQVKLFLSFLKSRYNQDFKESFFTFDGINFIVLYSNDLQKIDGLIKLLPNKQKFKTIKFGVFAKSVDQLKNTLADIINNKSKIKFDFFNQEDSVLVVIRIPNRVEEIVITDMLNKISQKLNDNLYSINGMSIVEQVALALKNANLKIAIAESYTAGGIASALC